MNDGLVWLLAIVMVLVMAFTGSTLKIIKQWEGAVVFRLGVCKGTLKPGLRMVVPFIDKLVRCDIRMLINDVPGQSVVTKDNISLSIDAVVFYRRFEKFAEGVQNNLISIRQGNSLIINFKRNFTRN